MSFYEFLSKFGIGGPSINVPEEYKARVESSYEYDKLVHIPSTTDDFLLEDPPTKEELDMDDLRKSFVQMQLMQIRDQVDISEDSLSLPTIAKPVIEIPGDFESKEEFISFKKAIAVEYKKKSENFGFKEPIRVCESPICVNPAIPGFDHCANHLVEDPNFEDQLFLKRCAYVSDSGRCTTPCSAAYDMCTIHRKQPCKRNEKKGNEFD